MRAGPSPSRPIGAGRAIDSLRTDRASVLVVFMHDRFAQDVLLAALAARAGDHVDFLAHDRETRAGVFNAGRTELLSRLVDAMAPAV